MTTPNEITITLAERGFLLADYEIFDLDPNDIEIYVAGGTPPPKAVGRVVGPEDLNTLDRLRTKARDLRTRANQIEMQPAMSDADHTRVKGLCASALSLDADAKALQAGHHARPATQAEAMALVRSLNARFGQGQGSRYVPDPKEVAQHAGALRELLANAKGPVKGFNNRSRIFADKLRMLAALKTSMAALPPAAIPPCDPSILGAGIPGIMSGCSSVRILHAPDGWVVRHAFTASMGGQEMTYRTKLPGDVEGVSSAGPVTKVQLPVIGDMLQKSKVYLFLEPQEVLAFVGTLTA